MPWQDKLRQLSPTSEFVIVIGLTFGVSFALFLLSLAQRALRPRIEFGDAGLLGLLAYEIAIGLLLGAFLYVRGWRLTDANLRLTRNSLGRAGALFAGFYLYQVVVGIAANALEVADTMTNVSFQGSVSLPMAVLVSVINPVFEEVLTVAYVTKALNSQGAAFAIGVSALLRLIAHAYQGPLAVVVVFPLGVAFAIVYWRTRDLWPLIVTHGLIDLVGLLSIRAATVVAS